MLAYESEVAYPIHQVVDSVAEIDSGTDLSRPALLPAETSGKNELSNIVGEVPSFHTGIVSITGESVLSNPAALGEYLVLSDVIRVVCELTIGPRSAKDVLDVVQVVGSTVGA